MRLHRIFVGGLERFCRVLQRTCSITFLHRRDRLLDPRLLHSRINLIHRRQAGPVRPFASDRFHGLDRPPFGLGHHADEVAFDDSPDEARYLARRGVIDRFEPGLHRGRAHDASVQHAAHLEVLHIRELAGHFARDIDAWNRLADDPERLGFFQIDFLVERHLERAALGQGRIGNAPASAGDHAVLDFKVTGRRAELLRRESEHRPLCACRSLAQLQACDLDREAAPGRTLVGREQCIALNDANRRERYVELVGHHLRQRGLDSRAEFDMAAIDRHVAVAVDREPCVYRLEVLWCRGRRLPQRLCDRAPKAEAHHQRAAGLQELPPGYRERSERGGMFHPMPPAPRASRRRQCAGEYRSGTDCRQAHGVPRLHSAADSGRERPWPS